MIDKIPNDTKLLETLLTRQLEIQVSKHIRELVQPKIDSLVKTLAGEAVKNWITDIRTEKTMVDPYNQGIRIQVNFVENIIRTEVIKNDIEIVVNESKK